MDISFADERLKAFCEQRPKAVKSLGQDSADKLRRRLADLSAADSVSELVAGRPHPLAGDRAGQFAVDLARGVRLVFVPDHEQVPQKDDGGVDWNKVTKVKVVYVGNYHD